MHSERCQFCHDTGFGALRNGQGADLSIGRDWRPTLMANSFRDPYWRAKVEREVEENPHLQAIIEDKCTRCHAPMANAQARLNGAAGLSLTDASRDPLAADGVSCTLCHQIEARGLGTPASFTGKFRIGAGRKIFGPYADAEVFPMPMRNHVDYTPVHGAQVTQSALCGTCHTLYTPIIDAGGRIAGEFPEQTPYLEWRQSDFAREGRHCQDCHMPRIDEAVRISSRPPWLKTTHQPFWRHAFVGGNTVIPGILAAQGNRPGANAAPDEFRATIERTQQQLGNHTARLRLRTQVTAGELLARVTVENLTGHKFPTGFPSRRAWLHVTVTAADGTLVFESGAHQDGRLVHEPAGWQPHHAEIRDPTLTQIYEAVMADTEGAPTTTLLRAASYLKDNRLPPRGFRPAGPQAADVAVRGAATRDRDFHREASGSDTVRYRIPLGGRTADDLTVQAELLYQILKPGFADHLFAGRTPAVLDFKRQWHAARPAPRIIARAARAVDPGL